MRTPPASLALALALFGCDPQNELNVAEPEVVVEPATVDFAEVVLGTYAEIGAVIRNDGLGTLRIDGAEFESGSSSDFTVLSWPAELKAHDSGLIVMQYTPDVEGADWGTLLLQTNQPDKLSFPVSVTGLGVKPCIDIDPELLWFGTVAPGESVTREFQVRAGCTGNLQIASAAFPGSEASAYSVTLPDDWASPYVVRTGFSFTASVTFSPPDTAEWVGELWFTSNDPDDAVAAVTLKGNTVDDPTENEAPVVEITEPDVGESFLDNQTVTLTGAVYDADEAVTNLTCDWRANGSKIDNALIDSDGVVVGSAMLPVGDVTVSLRCFDSEGEMAEDSVSVAVWKHDEPLEYVITGGATLFDYFRVDDDVTFFLNDATLYKDDNDTQDNLAPISFEAKPGDSLQIQAVDQNACDAYMAPLTLHWGTGQSQALNEAFCASSCPEHACYDGTYVGPWPAMILDETYTIAIP